MTNTNSEVSESAKTKDTSSAVMSHIWQDIAELQKDFKASAFQNRSNDNKLPALELCAASPAPQGEVPQGSVRVAGRRPIYEHAERPEHDIRPENVIQGGLGDCYFLSTVAGIAKNNPAAIRDMIKDNSDGTYTVTFPGDKSHPITVTPPAEADLARFSQYSGGTWAHILETAHRKYTNKWSDAEGQGWKPENGGDPADAIKLLTGKDAITIATENLDQLSFERIVSRELANKRPVVASTDESSEPGSAIPPCKVEDGHAYTILGIDQQHHRVILRNPWGENNDGVNDSNSFRSGVFSISTEDFMKSYTFVSKNK